MNKSHTRRGYTQNQVVKHLSLLFANGGFTRPQRTEKLGIVSRYFPLTCPPGILSLQGEGLFPMRGKVGEARMRGYQIGKHYRQPLTWHYVPSSPARGEVNGTREKGALMRGYSLGFTRPSSSRSVLMRDIGALYGIATGHAGFTLIEILVVVLIIGILGAIMLPQYQRAVLKSRFAALMPIAKSMADSNEAFYLEHGEYADNAEDLPVQGRRNYSDGTELEFGTTSEYSYVLATRDNDFPNKYIVYQKHSEQFPGEIHCEAASDNTLAQDVCKSFGPTQELGETLTSGYLTYVLFGTGNGVAPTGDEGGDEPDEPTCEGVSCDDQGNITECSSGQTLNNGACENCATAFPGATSCSATSYAATACGEGYNLTNGACVAGLDPAIQAKVNAVLASSTCTGQYAGYCHDNGDGTISRCNRYYSTYDAEHNKCMPSVQPGGSGSPYEDLYNADGKHVERHWCLATSTSGSQCNARYTFTYDPATGNPVSEKRRSCQTDVVMDENFNCANGTYSSGADYSYSPTTGNQIALYNCTGNSVCSTYSSMTEWNDTRTQQRTCKTLSTTSRACDEWNAWVSGNW